MDINTTRLRCLLGWLAVLVPWIVCAFVWAFPPSISETWYTNACTPFMIILGASSILLISYKGYGLVDDILTTITGVLGIGICLFPCYPTLEIRAMSHFSGLIPTPFMLPYETSSNLHLICAYIFFGLLAINALFLFTKSSGVMTENKKKRNVIYRVCGIGMMASFLLMLLELIPAVANSSFPLVWFVEMLALTFFGVSWLTKADYYPWLFADKKVEN